MDNSPRRAVERTSPSHRGFEHRRVRFVGRDEETSDSERKPWSNDRSETSDMGNLINGYKRQGLRALIHEYGNDRGQRTVNDKPPKFGHLDMNGTDNTIPNKTWQKTEEEEYDWKDMNSTFSNCKQSNNVLPTTTPFGSFTTRPGSGPVFDASLESDLKRSKWSTATMTISPHTGNLPDVDVQLCRFPSGASRMASPNVNSINMEVQSATAQSTTGTWPHRNVPNTHILPLISNFPQPKQPGYQFNLTNSCTTVANQDPNMSLFLPELSSKLPQMPSYLTGNALSGLISSLITQGLMTLPKQLTIQDSVGLEFNVDVLKVRHESAVSALYGDMSRQCATCGLRFKCQEEHNNHMAWHVIKNRVLKNCKGSMRSQGWFASASMWLSCADASGTNPVPAFLLSNSIVENKDHQELVVPADEDQTVCALCRERFDDYYSDETDEWMYRGAVYLNAPVGSITGMDMGMDRTQLGPIVHAKCRSEPKVVSLENCAQGSMEEEDGENE